MAKQRIHLAVGLMVAKLAPTSPRPGPRLLMAAATAVKAVVRSRPVAARARYMRVKQAT